MVEKTVSRARKGARVDAVGTLDRFDHLTIRLQAGKVRAEVIADLAGRAARALAAGTGRLAARLRQNWRRQTTLAELAKLDDRILKDIGLSRDQIASAAIRAVANENQRRTPDAA